MPQDLTFDLPIDTPVSRHPEYAQERHLCRQPVRVRGRSRQEPQPVA